MLLIIGLDGATWDVAEPLIAAGRMPNLAALRRSGAWGPLMSTVPPATFPSWSTFATGVNPGRHGIFDFTRRVFGTYEVEFINATYRDAPSIWRRLSDAGKRVGVLGLPGTYPPERLNGCMISGFDTPVTTHADASFIDPPELVPLVMQQGGFPFADFQEFRIDADWYRTARQRLLHGIELKTKLAARLLREDRWDCFLLLFGESDTVAHHFWKFHDPTSPRFDGADGEMSDTVNTVYERLDTAIGELVATAKPDSVVVLSDHGFGGAGRKILYVNRWLSEHGFQKRRPGAAGSLSSELKRLALQMIPGRLQARAFRLQGGRWASRLESRSRFSGIEWGETTAFSEELNYFPSLWLNLKDREPAGRVAADDYHRVVADLCAAVREISDPQSGKPVIRNAWPRDEIYTGPWVKYAPDIVLDLNLDNGHSYNCMPSGSGIGSGVFQTMDLDGAVAGKLSGMSGSHRSDGLFAASGTGLDGRGYFPGAHIADMAPTLMSLMGVEIPPELEGRAIRDGCPAEPPRSVASADQRTEPQPYSVAEEREIAARLENLGYLD